MNNTIVSEVQKTLDAWRDQGADCLDPVRFQFIQALANRAKKLTEGDAKRGVDKRLTELVQQYAAQVGATPTALTPTPATTASIPPEPSMLAELLTHLATMTSPDNAAVHSNSVGNLREHYPELPVLDEFRSTWSRVSAIRQVLQSETQVHENAGPLNSNHLVHRALSMMRDVSPGYLHQFLSYLDALAWMEQLQISNEPPAKATKRTVKKSTAAVKSPKSTTSRAKKKAPKPEEA